MYLIGQCTLIDNISEFKYSLGLYENILEMYLTHNI
jgi:hypothetical protein